MDQTLPADPAMAILFSTAKEPRRSSVEDPPEAFPLQPVLEKGP
jgi:hypothetical protein